MPQLEKEEGEAGSPWAGLAQNTAVLTVTPDQATLVP